MNDRLGYKISKFILPFVFIQCYNGKDVIKTKFYKERNEFNGTQQERI